VRPPVPTCSGSVGWIAEHENHSLVPGALDIRSGSGNETMHLRHDTGLLVVADPAVTLTVLRRVVPILRELLTHIARVRGEATLQLTQRVCKKDPRVLGNDPIKDALQSALFLANRAWRELLVDLQRTKPSLGPFLVDPLELGFADFVGKSS
jgi:hypothetical protein